MSVHKMGLLPGRSADFSRVAEGKAELRWLAETDNNFDDELVVRGYGYGNGILPIPYVDFHPLYETGLCRSISFNQDSSAPRKWEIKATYSDAPIDNKEQVQNPTERPAQIKWKAQPYRKAIEKDINGKAIVNSAGDYFDPPPEIDSSHWVVTITKNVVAVPSVILEYTDAINASSFTIQGIGIDTRVAKIVDLDIGDLQIECDFEYYVFTFSLEFRPETWKLKPLDQGYRYKSGTSRKQIMDDSTPPRPITSPKLLNGSGAVLPDPTTANAVFLSYDVYNEKDFSILPGLGEF